MKDTKNFKASEFQCPCCGKNDMKQELVDRLQMVRDVIGKPLKINSGYRCSKQNIKDGGKPNSAHLRGYAVDIVVSKTDSSFRFALVTELLIHGFRRIGIGKGFIHADLDPDLPKDQMWIY